MKPVDLLSSVLSSYLVVGKGGVFLSCEVIVINATIEKEIA